MSFSKYYILYTFAIDSSLTIVLTQKYSKGNEVPISFMSSELQGVELNYPEVEKQAFIVLKALKHFKR